MSSIDREAKKSNFVPLNQPPISPIVSHGFDFPMAGSLDVDHAMHVACPSDQDFVMPRIEAFKPGEQYPNAVGPWRSVSLTSLITQHAPQPPRTRDRFHGLPPTPRYFPRSFTGSRGFDRQTTGNLAGPTREDADTWKRHGRWELRPRLRAGWAISPFWQRRLDKPGNPAPPPVYEATRSESYTNGCP